VSTATLGHVIEISRPRSECANGVHRVSFTCAGEPVWFESADAPLQPSIEAALGLFLLPALHHRARLVTDLAPDRTWLEGVARLVAIASRWWGYGSEVPIDHPGSTTGHDDRHAAVGSCFTGGLDSFYALLTRAEQISHLVYVHGYDIALEDEARIASVDRVLLEVARRTGKRTIRVRSNLRAHRWFGSVNWERTHGAALAAIGHVLGGTLGTLIIPSSYRVDRLIPWGSHPEIDPLWSTSRVSIEHDDVRVGREDKVARIVHEPMVWSHLRVCWQNRPGVLNCSRCPKCIRMILAVSAHGRRREFEVFDRETPLVDLVDSIPAIREHLVVSWRNILELDLERDVRRAVERMLTRSGHGLAAKIARGRRGLSPPRPLAPWVPSPRS